MANWYLAVNTMDSNDSVLGRVISTHRTVEAAERACRRAQPSRRHNPGSYVPCVVRASERRLGRGAYVPRRADWHTWASEAQ